MPSIKDWNSVDVRVIALRSGETWNHALVRLVLDSAKPSKVDLTDLPNIEGVLVAHKSLDIKELDALLESLSVGELDINGKKVNLKSSNTNPPLNYSYSRIPRPAAQQQLAISSAALYVQFWSGQSVVTDWGDFDKIETALRASKHPWDGFDDLYTGFGNVSPNFARSRAIRLIEVIAPIAVWITKASIQQDNRLTVEVKASPAISVGDAVLSAIGYFEGNTQERIQSESRKLISPGHFSFHVTFSQRLLLVKGILVYRKMDVDRVELLGKPRLEVNPRLVIIQEDGPEAFLESLRKENDKLFEQKISNLFHMLGLSVGHYGKLADNNPDLLAFSNSNDWVLVVECTEREPDINNHFTKLATRTKLIPAKTPNTKAYSVLVTKFPRSMLNETEKDRAMKERVSVVTSDDFESLLKMAIEGPTESKVLERIREMIPSEPGGMSPFN